MKLIKRDFLISVMIAMIIGLACNMPSFNNNGNQAALTLQAIYAQQTSEAMAKPTEIPQTEIIEEPTAVSTATQEEAGEETIEEPAEEAAIEPTVTIEVIHNLYPGEPGWISQWQLDSVSSGTASQNRVSEGDYLNRNLLERPFTAQDMIYHRDVDLERVEISVGDTFYYFNLHMNGINDDEGFLAAHYGVEIDTDRDGRGDFLLWAAGDGNQEWNIDQVYVYTDSNNDVGASRPMLADAPNDSGDSYDRLLFSPDHLDDPDAAWKRVNPSDSSIMQLAIKKSTINNAATFLWNAWADGGLSDPTQLDYNDVYTLAEAGSPLSSSEHYPLNALYLTDNSCRLAYGFEPTGDEPGICPLPVIPTDVPPTQEPTPEPEGCNCDEYPNYTFIDTEECCVECGFIWYGTSEFPCGPPVEPPPCDCSDYPNYTFMDTEECCTYCGYTWYGTAEFPCGP